MKIVNCVLTFLLLLSVAIIVSSCTEEGKQKEAVSFLLGSKPESWLLSERIDSFQNRQKIAPSIVKNGLSRESYLKIIEGQVRAFQKYQNDSGRIIDPVAKKEMYFTTPCYAHSISVLAASGFTKDKKLIESGMLAMDVVTQDMARNWSAGRHGDFYTWPVMFAFKLFNGIADEKRQNQWGKNIERMNPKFFYNMYLKFGNNWNIVNTAGEFLRYKAGYTSLNYVDTCLKSQLSHFTDYGMYNENGNPFPYDLFSRHYISGMLALGYHGKNFEKYSEIVTKGAWMSLFLQSPFGELPTGFRSSHHIWNEAEQCVIFEIFASQYAKNGEREKAGAFKRAAMLSLGSINEWLRPDGSGYIVKNKYPVEARHGYEVYSVHACYNMLATSMLAQAWQFSNDTIEEKPSPADLGGYVLPIIEPFHKIVASVGQTYLEYDTRGDQLYNPTGILRIHMMGSHPQLGPSDGCAEKYSGKGIAIATGPSWKNSDGTWSSLAGLKPDDPIIEIIKESRESAKFKVTYNIRGNNGVLTISETITAEKGKITIEDELIGTDFAVMRVNWPMLTFNGEKYTTIQIDKNDAILELEGKKIKFQIIEPENVSLSRSGVQYGHRNGVVEPLVANFKGNKATYTISLVQ
jgi:hypothetical protein